MIAKTPGTKLFSRYVLPCFEEKEVIGEISGLDFEKLKSYVMDNKYLRLKTLVSLFKRCVPNAVRGLEMVAKGRGSDMWSVGTVSKYWRYYHGHEGDCAVVVMKVVFASTNGILATFDHEKTAVLNPYGLSLKVGDKVFVHKRVVAEKLERAVGK